MVGFSGPEKVPTKGYTPSLSREHSRPLLLKEEMESGPRPSRKAEAIVTIREETRGSPFIVESNRGTDGSRRLRYLGWSCAQG